LAHVTLQSLLAEAGGAGELVDRLALGPVQLVARTGGKPTSAIFESHPGSARPSFRMEIKQRSPGILEFTLQVDRAVLSHDPGLCSAAKPSTIMLTTSFVIDDGQRPPVMAATAVPWECVGKNPSSPRRRSPRCCARRASSGDGRRAARSRQAARWQPAAYEAADQVNAALFDLLALPS
jgi:hypothetical protein